MELGLLQYSPQNNSIEENIQLIINETKNTKNALIVLPELFLTSYYTFTPFENHSALSPLLKHTKKNKLTLIGSIAIKHNNKTFNQSISIQNGTIKGSYNKRRLYTREKELFSQGDNPYEILKYKSHKYITQICLDNIDPDIPRHAMLNNGIIFLAAPSTTSVDFLRTILKARSLENQIISIFANRCGKEENNITYCGSSAIFLPNGTEITADKTSTTLKTTTISEEQIEKYLKTRTMILENT